MRATVCIMLLIGTVPAHAEDASATRLDLPSLDAIDLPFDHDELRMTARGSTPGTFGGGADYQDGSVALSGAVTLYSADKPGLRVLAQFRLEGEQADSSMFASGEQIVKGSLGVTGIYESHHGDLYALYVGAAIAATYARLSESDPMPTAIGIGTARIGSLIWMYGGGYSYVLGKPLPLGGVIWRASSTWTLSTLLPLFIDLRHELTTKLAVSLVLSASGDHYELANDGELAGAADTLTLKLLQARLGLKALYKLEDRWSLWAEAGLIGPRRLQITDGKMIAMSATGQVAAYLSMGVSYAFGH